MRRLFWLAMGVTMGAIVAHKLTRAAARFTPRGAARTLSEAAGRAAGSVREFVEDARGQAAIREAELRESAGLDGRR